jgi:short-subunit dehydrogenase
VVRIVQEAVRNIVITLSEMLHAELAEQGSAVGVTVLTPGGIRTETILAALANTSAANAPQPPAGSSRANEAGSARI